MFNPGHNFSLINLKGITLNKQIDRADTQRQLHVF